MSSTTQELVDSVFDDDFWVEQAEQAPTEAGFNRKYTMYVENAYFAEAPPEYMATLKPDEKTGKIGKAFMAVFEGPSVEVDENGGIQIGTTIRKEKLSTGQGFVFHGSTDGKTAPCLVHAPDSEGRPISSQSNYGAFIREFQQVWDVTDDKAKARFVEEIGREPSQAELDEFYKANKELAKVPTKTRDSKGNVKYAIAGPDARRLYNHVYKKHGRKFSNLNITNFIGCFLNFDARTRTDKKTGKVSEYTFPSGVLAFDTEIEGFVKQENHSENGANGSSIAAEVHVSDEKLNNEDLYAEIRVLAATEESWGAFQTKAMKLVKAKASKEDVSVWTKFVVGKKNTFEDLKAGKEVPSPFETAAATKA